MKKELFKFKDSDGTDMTLYAVKVREEGTRKVSDGIIIHSDNDEFCERDFLCCPNIDIPETQEEAETFMEYVNAYCPVKDFRIDGNGYYIFTD